jgi:hypothetical protein
LGAGQKKEAEEKYQRERHAGKAEIAFYILLLIVLAVVLGAIHVAEWMFNGGNLIPSGREAIWALGAIAIPLAGAYLGGRYEEAKSIRDQRLIRLEMKIDELLDRQGKESYGRERT